jgi:hypothetical protein
MSQKTVKYNGEDYLVENTIGKLLCVTLDHGNGKSKTATMRNFRVDIDKKQDAGERGIALSMVIIEAIDSFGSQAGDEPFSGIFDERKINDAGFGNLIKITIINAIFKNLLDIEPLNMDGTVKPEFQ